MECLDLSLVDDVLCQAFAIQWTGGLVFPGAAALLDVQGSLALANDLGVLAGDDVPKVGHRPVGDFDCLPIQGLVARVVGGEALVQDLEELSANIGRFLFLLLLTSSSLGSNFSSSV